MQHCNRVDGQLPKLNPCPEVKWGSKTIYCHHFSADGRHCVANALPPSEANLCLGV